MDLIFPFVLKPNPRQPDAAATPMQVVTRPASPSCRLHVDGGHVKRSTRGDRHGVLLLCCDAVEQLGVAHLEDSGNKGVQHLPTISS